jgi:glycosyltransferase involved in cell wall biosynthesis
LSATDGTGARLPITGIVIAKDEADRIGRCVASLASVCSEVLVLDSGSIDDTVAVARAHGARVEHQDWLGFAAQKNVAIERAAFPWILLLDADEWFTDEALAVIQGLFADGEVERADVWAFSRRTHFLGATLDHGGWNRERVGRLFRQDLRFQPLLVHEKLARAGRIYVHIDTRIEHDTARSQAEYATKLSRYALLWARQRRQEGRRATLASAPLHAAGYWLRACLLLGGFLDGATALRFHALHARYTWDKYRLLRRATRGEML